MIGKYPGTDKPTLKLLNKHYRDKVAPHWYDFGIQLLENECVDKLHIIEKNHPGDVERCCTEMFIYWLQVDTEASWNKIADALEVIGQSVLAKKIKDVTKGSYVKFINSICYISCWVIAATKIFLFMYIRFSYICEICIVARLVAIVTCVPNGKHASS